jgi:hypothetical protein
MSSNSSVASLQVCYPLQKSGKSDMCTILIVLNFTDTTVACGAHRMYTFLSVSGTLSVCSYSILRKPLLSFPPSSNGVKCTDYFHHTCCERQVGHIMFAKFAVHASSASPCGIVHCPRQSISGRERCQLCMQTCVDGLL